MTDKPHEKEKSRLNLVSLFNSAVTSSTNLYEGLNTKKPNGMKRRSKLADNENSTRTLPFRVMTLNNEFSAKIQLSDNTSKTVDLNVNSTSEDVRLLLVTKLNIVEEANSYNIYEQSPSGERLIQPFEVIFDVMSRWTERRVILFKKTTLQRHHSDDEELETTVARKSRRVAKIANLFGVNETKTEVKGKTVELKNIEHLLQNTTTVVERAAGMEIFKISRIYKDGWLQREEKGKMRNCWCVIENDSFSVSATNMSSSINLKVSACQIHNINGNLSLFEIKHKLGTFQFIAENSEVCQSWIDAFKHCSTDSVTEKFDEVFDDNKESVSIEDFDIHSVLGRGKFGKVLLCRQKSSRKVFAIKAVKKSYLQDVQMKKNSITENYILRSIRHPFLVSIEYAFQSIDRIFFVMNFVAGGELFYHVGRYGKLSEERVRFYAAELLSGLQCLHGKGIVYR